MDLLAQVRSGLQSQGLPSPSTAWIQTALPSRHPLPPLPALIATVRTRFLAADLTKPALFDSPSPAFPVNACNPDAKEAKLTWDVPVQVLDIENLSKSKWEQVEELEAIARGEQTRGREIIRLPIGDEENELATQTGGSERPGVQNRGGASVSATTPAAGSKSYTHRLVLQDCKGQRLYGLELKRIDKIGVTTISIGEKMLLKRGAILARGMVLLDPATCTILGGRVEAWQKDWVEGRLSRLRAAVEADNRNPS